MILMVKKVIWTFYEKELQKTNQEELRIEKVIKKKGNKTDEIEKKIIDHNHYEYITTPEFIKLTAENFAARLAHANLATKSDITNFVNKTDFDEKLKNLNEKVTSNKKKYLIVENKLKKLQTFD